MARIDKDVMDRQFSTLDRAVLYARVSRDDRSTDGRNLQGQLDMGREFAQQKHYKIVAELAEDDRGASGYEIDLPKLSKIREMARSHRFDVLIVRELDRLSRNLAKQLIIEEELRRCGVRIEYVLAEYDDTPEGRLSKHIRATIAEYEREKIRERMLRGKHLKLKSGKIITGRPPYGYQIDDNMLTPHEPEAKIVRLIFEWFVLDGISVNGIANKLTDLAVLTYSEIHRETGMKKKSGVGVWNEATVRQMLKNKTYIGIWQWGKRKYGAKSRTMNPEDKRITVEVEPLIDKEIWDLAQQLMQDIHTERGRLPRRKYLFSKRIRCACGASVVGATRKTKTGENQYYCCCTSKNPKKYAHRDFKCRLPYFRTDVTDNKVWEWLENCLREPGVLWEGFKKYQSKQNSVNEPILCQIEAADGQIKEHGCQLETLLRSLNALEGRNSDRAKALILHDIEQLETTLDKLEAKKATLVAKLHQNELTKDHIRTIEYFLSKIAKGLDKAKQDFEYRRKMIEILDIRVTLCVENDEMIAYVACRLWDDKKRVYLKKRLS